jgi:hypothetical protein
MVTPRGYTNKYEWDGTVREGQRPGYSLVLPREDLPREDSPSDGIERAPTAIAEEE